MSKTTLSFLFFCLSALLFSCKDEKGEQQLLNGIEQTWQLCETSMSEAKARTEGMKDSVKESTEHVRQKYNLLTIRLRDKFDVVPSSPDSAKRAVSYFDGREDDCDKERAFYYLGSAYRDLKDYPRAISLFLKAVDVAEKGRDVDTLIWQNALSQLRYLYMLVLNYEEELNVAKQAVELAKASSVDSKGRRNRSTASYLMDVASAYEHQNDTLHCLLYCDLAYKAIREEQFPQRYGDVMSYMLALYSNYGHYEKVGPLLRHLSQMPANERPGNYELCLARHHENQERTDSAIAHYIIYYNKERSATGRYEATAGLQRCYFRKGDFRQAALWGQRLYETNDSIIAQRAFEQTQRARDEFRYHRDLEAERAIMQRDKYLIFYSIIAGLVALCLATCLVAYYNFRRKKFVEEIVGWKKLLEQKAAINKELTRMALMNEAKVRAEDVVERFHNIAAGKAYLTVSSWKDLMTATEALYPGFIEAVQERMDGPIREPLLRTICLMKIGLKPMQIAKVMDAKIQTVWNRVKRAEEICGYLLNAPKKQYTETV